MKNFYYKDRRTFSDNLEGFEEVLLDSDKKEANIFFEFENPEQSLSKIKQLLLIHREKISFDNLYFYNAGDFVNFVLEEDLYLPKNINLFISETCPIGCTYCKNPNDIHIYLSLQKIQNFLDKYNVGDNMNVNILGQGDPIFNPELLDILSYIKSRGAHVTFFSGGKSFLFLKNFDEFSSNIDEFKINLSASNTEIYNKNHKNKITVGDFERLTKRFQKVAHKSTFITVLTKENLGDIQKFIQFVKRIGGVGLEIKKDLHYPQNYILDNVTILTKIEKLLSLLEQNKSLNFVSNIGKGYCNYSTVSNFILRSVTVLDNIIEKQEITSTMIAEMDTCFQFGNSLDIIETGEVAVCCQYDISIVSDTDYEGKYFQDKRYKQKSKAYKNCTPKQCKKCPMPIDRYKSYAKYMFVKSL